MIRLPEWRQIDNEMAISYSPALLLQFSFPASSGYYLRILSNPSSFDGKIHELS